MLKSALPVSLLGMMLALSSCGFHLRGPAQISDRLNPLHVVPGQLESAQLVLIKNALKKAGAHLSESSDKANHLIMTYSPLQRRNLAQSSPTGVQLVQLSMQLDYRVRASSGEWLVESRQITHNAEIELDNNNVLSHDKQYQSGMKDLQQNLVRSMIFQLKR